MKSIFLFFMIILILLVTFKNYSIKMYNDIPIKHNNYLVVQFDNRDFFTNVIELFINSDFNKLIKINKDYSKNHNLDYMYTKSYDNTIPVYWMKVKIITDLINNTDYKGIIWLDTDAVFTHENKSILDILNNDKSFYISTDPPEYNESALCVGTWIVKNNNIGVKIMNDWMNSYDPSLWRLEKNNWITDTNWAGIAYEQGSFNQIIYPKYKNHIEVLRWDIFNNDNKYNENSYISHYMGPKKELINDYY